MNDKHWMNLAYEQALLAQSCDEVPVGAVLVDKDNQFLSSGHNLTLKTNDPSSHAEVIAIRQAALKLGNHRLLGTTLYVTLEPCAMCAGLLVHARVKRVVFATRDFRSGAAGSTLNLLNGSSLNHSVIIDEGVMQKECSLLLSDFFKQCR
ncbi:tRNA adenosine(34) deaminase TadA [Legionella waltersii]|uniref:tRNA-specific adenosine deaminase n=1 Tax=Legionella waltersii TaxID=66969 RepID=A0A0W1AAT2_9GAMM|nr:tRNA adenosine(34) deaminase TadA [Legionella waltersii]KTD78449.1 tRNA-specific adenosine deaminase [Legionella waltersii]SNV05984.1 tRNA-specific adenosine deaminase [Legionella waltersii]